uniref:Uncharacterized protein n=1 Tax=Meloidogyne incognita TaxID=6306 RepID=A0A914KX23_MELIC
MYRGKFRVIQLRNYLIVAKVYLFLLDLVDGSSQLDHFMLQALTLTVRYVFCEEHLRHPQPPIETLRAICATFEVPLHVCGLPQSERQSFLRHPLKFIDKAFLILQTNQVGQLKQ